MKKTILTVAIFSALLIGCNENKNKETTEAMETTEAVHEHHGEKMEGMDNSWMQEIKLDGNDQWPANLETTESVQKMLDLIGTSDKNTLEDYKALATDLNEVKNHLVKNCTMEGPSHDNLHIFLHPLIEKINALGKVSTVDEGAEITSSIKENLNGYYKYFK